MAKTVTEDPDNPEWMVEDFAKAKPVDELPQDVRAFFPKLVEKKVSAGSKKRTSP